MNLVKEMLIYTFKIILIVLYVIHKYFFVRICLHSSMFFKDNLLKGKKIWH